MFQKYITAYLLLQFDILYLCTLYSHNILKSFGMIIEKTLKIHGWVAEHPMRTVLILNRFDLDWSGGSFFV